MEHGEILVHATCIAIAGRAALLRGAPGSGKSDLALRAILTPVQHLGAILIAELVADDQVRIGRRGDRLIARCPESIRGQIEVRGVGIMSVAHVAEAEIWLVIDLTAGERIERLPDERDCVDLLGCAVPRLRLAGFEASAPMKLLLALANADDGRTRRGLKGPWRPSVCHVWGDTDMPH